MTSRQKIKKEATYQMNRIMQAAHNLQQEKAAPTTIMASCDFGMKDSTVQLWLVSDKFFKAIVPISKLPMLAGEILAAGDAPAHTIIVDVNKNKINRSLSYVPKIAVICGSSMIQKAKDKGEVTINCWVGVKAAKALGLTVPKLEATLGYNPGPTPPNGIFHLPSTAMSNRSVSFPDFTDYGALGSELNNPTQFMSMLNIHEALSMYLNNLKNGIWKPVSSQWATVPLSLKDATNEAGLIAKEKGVFASVSTFSPLDFVKWQKHVLESPVKFKHVGKERLSASKFAFVGDSDDPSTWLFRADSKEAIQASAKEVVRNKQISVAAKKATMAVLKKRFESFC